MTRDSELNPDSGDYTGQVLDHLGNAVYLRLMTPLGSWWADPLLGSRLHELQREKDLARVRKLAVQYSEAALKPLLIDGRALKIRVTAQGGKDASGGGRCLLNIEVEDNSGRHLIFHHPVTMA